MSQTTCICMYDMYDCGKLQGEPWHVRVID